jgi:putative nucleotidyltransferase with HDIG domain
MALQLEPARAVSRSAARPSPSVLVVDDENGVRDLMSRWLTAGGFSVSSAAGADEALGLMRAVPPAVALCDIRMPGHDGVWLANRIRQEHPETAIIMATGVFDHGHATHLGDSVVDYLTKPFGRDRLRDAVVRGIEWHRSARDARCWRDRLEAEVELRRARLARAIGGCLVDSDEAIVSLLASLTAGQPQCYAHAVRVADLSARVAAAMGLTDEEVTTIRRGALLHDLGKLSMPEALLGKPAPLSSEEQVVIQQHHAIGSELVAGLAYLEDAAAIIRDAGERVDGLGRPGGARLDELSIGARIVAAADAYDTMIRHRVFRDAITARPSRWASSITPIPATR